MKLSKLFFILAAFVALTFAACSKDDAKGPNVTPEGELTAVTVNIKTPQATYAGAEEIGTDGTIGGTVTMVIFDKVGALEFYKEDVTVNTSKTQIIEVPSGVGKLVYIFANVPSLASIPNTMGMAVADFEKELQGLAIADISNPSGFFMANLKTPVGQDIIAGVVDPVLESKNTLSIEIGRLAARFQVTSAAVEVHEGISVTAPVIGAISDFEYKVRTIAKFSYLIGQPITVNGLTLNKTPYYNKEKGTTIGGVAPGPGVGVKGDSYDDYDNTYPSPGDAYKAFLVKGSADFDASGVPATHDKVSYVMENSNQAAPAGSNVTNGNTTRLTIKTVVSPNTFVNLQDGTAIVEAAPVVGTFWSFTADNKKYISKTAPTVGGANQDWFETLGLTIATDVFEHTGGVTYYTRFLAAPNTLTATNTIARNHVYKVNVTRVNGIGSSAEDGDLPDPEVPIEGKGNMVVDLTVVDWTVVDQDTGIGR